MNFGETFEEEGEFVAGWFFVVYDECIDRHEARGVGPGQYMRRRFGVQLRCVAGHKAEKLLTQRSQRAQSGREKRERRGKREEREERELKLFRGICRVQR